MPFMGFYDMNTSKALIETDVLNRNIRFLKSQLPDGTKQMAVIKADAYGHGAVKIAQFLSESVDWFGVATMEEAIELRENRIANPILVFEPPQPQFSYLYITHNLTAVVTHFDHFDYLDEGTDIHIEIDTGMGRLGFLPADVPQIINHIAENTDKLQLSGVMTHFANSDDGGDKSVQIQKNRFDEILKLFPENILIHVANSGAVLHYQDLAYDMVRHGISMYGYDPSGKQNEHLQPVLTWKSTVIQSRKIQKDWPVSYGSHWKAPKDGWLAVIPVGYADGLRRSLSNKLEVQIDGTWYPQVGTITMDYFMVFTGEKSFSAGEEVVIMGGERNNAYHIAELLKTIPYEILTDIHPKVERVYL